MKINDILRIAYDKTLKAPSCYMTHRLHPEEETKEWIESNFKATLFNNIFRMAYKRRAIECFPINEGYLEAIISGFVKREICVDESEPSYSLQDKSYLVRFDNYSINIMLDTESVSFSLHDKRVITELSLLVL